MYKVVQTSRLYEQIVRQIEDSILKGDLKEGEQLPPERDLALQFGVSRTAVREAVKTLREKGLVEAYPGRGTFITNGTSHSFKHTLDRMMRGGPVEGDEDERVGDDPGSHHRGEPVRSDVGEDVRGTLELPQELDQGIDAPRAPLSVELG